MKAVIIFITSFITTISVFAGDNEYVTLTAVDGRQVEAEILTVSFSGKDVTLRRKGSAKEVVVPVSTFDDESKSHIKSWLDEAKDKAEKTTEQYVTAWKSRDTSKLKQLFLDPKDLDEEWFQRLVNDSDSLKIQEIKYEETYFEARMEQSNGSGLHRTIWLQILPNGKIKYDYLIRHPVVLAMEACSKLQYYAKEEQQAPEGTISKLKEYGVPLFGYSPSKTYKDQIRSLKDIADWLLNEGEKWDATEPKIPCSKYAFKHFGSHMSSCF